MSIKVMSWVWENPPAQGGNSLLVMLALADWASDDGTHIFPSMKTIAGKTMLSERHVKRLIKSLEHGGYLIRDKDGWGRGITAHWRIPLKGDKSSPLSEKVTFKPEKVTNLSEKGDTHVTRSVREPLEPLDPDEATPEQRRKNLVLLRQAIDGLAGIRR